MSRKIGPKNQINLPGEYMRTLGMAQGEQVYIGENPDQPGTLVLIPESAMKRIFQKGWTSLG